MSPKNEVLPLRHLCMKTISELLIYLLCDEESRNYRVVADYLAGATYEVLQDLLKSILNTENLDAATRFSCLEVLLREDVKQLDTGIFPHSYYVKILEVIGSKGVGLQQLNLKGVWVRDFPELLCQMVKNLKCIKVLTIPHMPNDLVLESLISCKNITVLDISGESYFSADVIREYKSDKMIVLDIGSYGKEDMCTGDCDPFEIIAVILENMPNLKLLRTYSFTGKALMVLHKRKPFYKTQLTYIHDTGTADEEIRAIVNLCPNLENIYIFMPEKNVVPKLSTLKRIHSLKLSRFDMKDLLLYLQDAGCRLQQLKLSICREASLDLSQICYLSPNLQTLECFKLNLCYSHFDSYFMNLQNLEILYCNISNSVLRYLLVNAPFLKRIVVGDAVNMTDGDVFRLCAECDFVNLEELWFSCARGLTATSVELLMGHCRSLRVIGQLSGWDVNPSEVEFLREFIAVNNIQLTLLPVGVFP